jgi:hypothetical protein
MTGRRIVAIASVFGAFAFAAQGAVAGEITGNGVEKGVNGNSPCAYSGQEDLQWSDPGNVVRGVPARVQNWGHTAGKEGGANDNFALGFHWGCNARDFGLKN